MKRPVRGWLMLATTMTMAVVDCEEGGSFPRENELSFGGSSA